MFQNVACAAAQGTRSAAGDNLDLPVIGRIMRTCGAFFIRRSFKGPDARVYKATLDAYLHSLLFRGIPIEFFIEGGRTRDGRIAAPKLGLLASCVDAALLSRSAERPVAIVPVTITYDVPLEERGLLQELLGVPKQKETVMQFISAFGKLIAQVAWRAVGSKSTRKLGVGGRNGRVAVGFGEPVGVAQFLRARQKRRKRRGGARKGALAQASPATGACVYIGMIHVQSSCMQACLTACRVFECCDIASAEGCVICKCSVVDFQHSKPVCMQSSGLRSCVRLIAVELCNWQGFTSQENQLVKVIMQTAQLQIA